MGGRLCPWSRCLTWAKPAKQPPCQGRSPGCKPGQRGQTVGGQETAVHGGDLPSKTNHQLHFFTQNIVCLSVLPLSPVTASPPLHSPVMCSRPLPPTFSSSLFLCFSCVHKHTIYSHIPPNSSPQLLTPPALSGCLSFSS